MISVKWRLTEMNVIDLPILRWGLFNISIHERAVWERTCAHGHQ